MCNAKLQVQSWELRAVSHVAQVTLLQPYIHSPNREKLGNPEKYFLEVLSSYITKKKIILQYAHMFEYLSMCRS